MSFSLHLERRERSFLRKNKNILSSLAYILVLVLWSFHYFGEKQFCDLKNIDCNSDSVDKVLVDKIQLYFNSKAVFSIQWSPSYSATLGEWKIWPY